MGDTSDDERRRRGRRAASRRPNAGRPTSCWMRGAQGELGRDAPFGGARHGRGRPRTCSRARSSGIGPAITDGFYYDFQLPRPLTPDDLAAIEARMAREHRRGPPVRSGASCRRPRRAPFFVEHDQPFKVEIIDDLAAQGRGRRRSRCRRPPSTGRARSSTCAGARTSRAPAGSGRSSCSRSPGPTGAATRSVRCSSASTARPGRPRRSSTSTCGAASEAKKRDHRRLGVQLDLYSFHDVSPGSAFWHPKGQRIWRTLEIGDARAPGARRLRGGQHADPGRATASGSIGPLGLLPRQHVRARYRRPAVLAQADELPREHVHLQEPAALVPRPADPLRRVRPAPSQRAVRGAVRADPRPPVHPGRRPRLRPAGPAGRRDRWRLLGDGPRGVRLVRARAALHVRHEAGWRDRRRGAVGARRGLHPRGARTRRASRTPSSRRTARSTRPRSTSTSTTPSGASGRWRRSRPT